VVELYGYLRSRIYEYEVSLDLLSHDDGVELCLSYGEICTPLQSYAKSIRIVMSLEWADARMRYYD
jgi:hypothetical protein